MEGRTKAAPEEQVCKSPQDAVLWCEVGGGSAMEKGVQGCGVVQTQVDVEVFPVGRQCQSMQGSI